MCHGHPLPCTRARYGEVPRAEGSFPWLVPLGHAESWQDRAKGVNPHPPVENNPAT